MIRLDCDQIVTRQQRRRWTDIERAECAVIVGVWMSAAVLMAAALLAAALLAAV